MKKERVLEIFLSTVNIIGKIKDSEMNDIGDVYGHRDCILAVVNRKERFVIITDTFVSGLAFSVMITNTDISGSTIDDWLSDIIDNHFDAKGYYVDVKAVVSGEIGSLN